MPVYHLIVHAYGTWHPDNPDGWHQHGEHGTLRPHDGLARYRRNVQRFTTVQFSSRDQLALAAMVTDICARRTWRCHAVAVNETHLHAIVSWKDHSEPHQVHNTIKRLLGWRMSQLRLETARPWLSHGGKPQRVKDEEHLRFLVHDYFPRQGGVYWKEGDLVPGDG